MVTKMLAITFHRTANQRVIKIEPRVTEDVMMTMTVKDPGPIEIVEIEIDMIEIEETGRIETMIGLEIRRRVTLRNQLKR